MLGAVGDGLTATNPCSNTAARGGEEGVDSQGSARFGSIYSMGRKRRPIRSIWRLHLDLGRPATTALRPLRRARVLSWIWDTGTSMED